MENFGMETKRIMHMETSRTTKSEMEKDILFSKTIKAGHRIYYVDVKKNRKDELYLSITESKKLISGDAAMPQISYEKHKIFIYQEDFPKFRTCLAEAINFIEMEQGKGEPRQERDSEIKIDMEF